MSFSVMIAQPPAYVAVTTLSNARSGRMNRTLLLSMVTPFIDGCALSGLHSQPLLLLMAAPCRACIRSRSCLLPELRHDGLPCIEHLPIDGQDAVTSDLRWRRQKLGQAVINEAAGLRVQTRKQMPKRQPIAHAGLTKQDLELPASFRSLRCGIDVIQRRLKLRGRIFKEGCTGTARACPAKRSGGNDGLASVAFQGNEAECNVQ